MTKIQVLQREIKLLKSLIIGMVGKDPEGKYNPKFVKRILSAVSEKPKYEFKDKESFLKKLSST